MSSICFPRELTESLSRCDDDPYPADVFVSIFGIRPFAFASCSRRSTRLGSPSVLFADRRKRGTAHHVITIVVRAYVITPSSRSYSGYGRAGKIPQGQRQREITYRLLWPV